MDVDVKRIVASLTKKHGDQTLNNYKNFEGPLGKYTRRFAVYN